MATKPRRSRRGTAPNPALARPNYPYSMRLPDGRTLLVEVPGQWVTADRDGTPAFLPDGVRFLDRVRVAFLSVLNRPPSPEFLTTLREALGLTQREFAGRVGVDKMTVSRWERGALRPSRAALAAIEQVRKEALRHGVAIEG